MDSAGVLYGRRGLCPMALGAVDNALWDIAGKYAERPVIELIGGWPRERLAIHQTGGNIPEALARGVRNFKIGPHTPPDEMGIFVVRSPALPGRTRSFCIRGGRACLAGPGAMIAPRRLSATAEGLTEQSLALLAVRDLRTPAGVDHGETPLSRANGGSRGGVRAGRR